ncbi:MAG TPA: sigma-70 family RNA polymerase sigma factor [Thermoanaerobaculia bacterium]|jgi:RNA polymerase sigma-70 factor (ECF subfamily)|nr:sigma-70 family RNA polymerase sigma factor [Thermoanaerobaculia bacterium]
MPEKEEAEVARELVTRIYAGDPAAESELVMRYGPSIMRMLLTLSRNAIAAEDIYQDTFAVVLKRLRRRPLDQPEALRPFIRGTAQKILVACNRRRRRREQVEADPDLLQDIVDPRPGQLTRVLLEEEWRIVQSTIAGMRSARYRNVLSRFYLDQASKDLICQELGLSARHFHRVLFRARRRFLTSLGHAPGEHAPRR